MVLRKVSRGMTVRRSGAKATAGAKAKAKAEAGAKASIDASIPQVALIADTQYCL
jgi:hypothetical protein